MSDLFQRIKELDIDVEYPWMLHVIETAWSFTTDSIYWSSTEDCQEDPDTWQYSAEYYEAYNEQDGCYFFNYDNGCGETITAVFLKDKLVTFNE
jgi:hypothetical protein